MKKYIGMYVMLKHNPKKLKQMNKLYFKEYESIIKMYRDKVENFNYK